MPLSAHQITPNLSVEDVLKICSKNGTVFGGEILIIDKLKTAPIITLISEGKGFCSDVFRLEFSTDKNDYSLVAKIPKTRNFETSDLPEDEKITQKQRNAKMIAELHSNEIRFYEFSMSHFQKLSLKIPKFYFGREISESEEGLILMEDLSHHCSKAKFKGLQFLTDKQIKERICEIAKIQAWGFTILPEAEEALGKLETFKNALNFYFNQSLDALVSKEYPWLTAKRLQNLKNAAKAEAFNQGCMGNFLLPLVLCHDDFWAGNLLFSDADGSLLTILDWQIARFASPTQDLAALLALGLPGQQRRESQIGYLQFYFDQLKHFLDCFNVKDDRGYRSLDFKDLEKVYRISLKISIFRVIITWQNYDYANPAADVYSETPLKNWELLYFSAPHIFSSFFQVFELQKCLNV